MSCRIAVIGGGISGLAAAHRLRELDPRFELLVFEAGDRLGGVIQTTHQRGFVIEEGADNFFTSPPAAANLCRRLGLAEALIDPEPTRRQALVVSRGRLLPVPADFQLLAPRRLAPLCATPILSLRGKLRAACEYFVPWRKETDDEALASFVSRRFGREFFDRLVQPLVGGIYAADAHRLSIQATMPRFPQMEREHGSLIRAMLHSRRRPQPDSGHGARHAHLTSLRGGMSTLIDTLAAHLPAGAVRCATPVDGIFPIDHQRWLVAIGGEHPRMLPVDGVIVATPAQATARIVEHVDQGVADDLRRVEYAGSAVVSLAYERSQIGHPLNALGFVVPLIEERMILSCSFSSVKYRGRAPSGTVLLRVFIGGANQSGLLRLPRQQLLDLAEREVADLLQIRGAPLLRHAARRAMPQYPVGHLNNIARIDARLQRFPTLALAGSALYGVGIPNCVQSGESAAERVASHLHSSTTFHRSLALAFKETVG